MKQCIQTDVVHLVMELLTGEEHRTIEAAKQLIAHADRVDPELLSRVLAEPGYKSWSKVMAAYVLGFLPAEVDRQQLLVLRDILADKSQGARLRDHAAEALGNLQDETAIRLLAERLSDESESRIVRKSCIYALSQLSSLASVKALKCFALTGPKGMLARELASAGVVAA